MRYGRLVKLDPWARELIVDPLSKQPLIQEDNSGHLVAPYGRRYPVVDGIFDLRLLNNETTGDQRLWREGQRHYEEASRAVRKVDPQENQAELNSVRHVYEEIPVEGDCLDVGGHQGRLRAFLAPNQGYISCDPFLRVFEGIEECSNLLTTYPFLLEPVNFVCCDAEFLPFRSCCFQTVHMRSVVDHFLSPEMAFGEAYRVLQADGNLIVGLFVEGGKTGHMSVVRRLKESVKSVLPALGIKRFRDHHTWHPTYERLVTLLSDCGFRIAKVHWQQGYEDTVCYLKCVKCNGVVRRST